MESSVTKTFREQLRQLPVPVQEQAAKAYTLWSEDPYHNSLQFKRVSQRQPIDSARISIRYPDALRTGFRHYCDLYCRPSGTGMPETTRFEVKNTPNALKAVSSIP